MVWPPRDDAVIQGFFDRTKLRASLRKGQERLNVAIAHAEKLTALGTLVAGVAHEINNPLTVLQFGLEAYSSLWAPLADLAQKVHTRSARGWGANADEMRELGERAQTGAPPHEAKQLLEDMLGAVTSIANIVRDLRVFARSDSNREEPQILDANDVVDQALRLVGRQFSRDTRVERDYARDLPHVLVPHGRLTQVLVNVLVNASHAISEVERPVHRVRVVTRTDGEYVAMSISDTGPGIAQETLEHIFDPFFTTKRAGYGTGLGLSISRSIMHDLGGDLIVESVHGEGATFILLLPIPDHASVRKAYLRASTVPPLGVARAKKHTVLIVDDDEHVLGAYARALARSYHVLLAADGREAIDLLSSGSSADAVVTELALPDVDGKALYKWLRAERPELAASTVFVSTDASLQRYSGFLDGLANKVLAKPATAAALLAALYDALARLRSEPPPRPE
jgi:signal transduction histidine kinase/ActR/RegA family two-component response regulator